MAFASVAVFALAACASISVFYGSQHPEAVLAVWGVYVTFVAAVFAVMRLTLPLLRE